jgi:hypothetical protein
MMDVAAVRAALSAAAEAQGYRSYDVLPDDVELPAVAVGWPDEVLFNQSMGGKAVATIDVKVAVSASDARQSQRAIDAVMSWPGIVKGIQDFETDAWPKSGCAAVSASGVRPVTFGTRSALMVDLTFTIRN